MTIIRLIVIASMLSNEELYELIQIQRERIDKLERNLNFVVMGTIIAVCILSGWNGILFN